VSAGSAPLSHVVSTLCDMTLERPTPDCPLTDFDPAPCTSFGDQMPESVCSGRHGQVYPAAALRAVL
jgi:hypothetical protein